MVQKYAFTQAGGVDEFALALEETRNEHASRRGTEDPNCGDEKTACLDQDDFAGKAPVADPHGVGSALRGVDIGAAVGRALYAPVHAQALPDVCVPPFL